MLAIGPFPAPAVRRPAAVALAIVLAAAILAPALSSAVGPVLAIAPAPAIAPASTTRRYIVQLADPPLAAYRGALHRRAHLAVDTPASRAYTDHLAATQDGAVAAIRAVAPRARVDWRYRYTFNGFTVKVTPAEAMRIMHLPGVVGVHAEEFLQPEMDSTLRLINAAAAWAAGGGAEEAGLGARIAIVDTGVDARHPFMADAGMPAPPAGYPKATMHLRDGTVLDYPNQERYVNGKVIAARAFPSPEMVEGMASDAALARFTPFSGGHGMHVAGIAAGRAVTHQLPLIWDLSTPVELSGVAPMAWVLNYKYDFSTGNEYAQGTNVAGTPELIAMLDQMVVDEVDVLNMSEGHVTFLIDHPATHPLSVALGHAADAGIVPVFSAGNAGGNGRMSLSGAFKHSDKVLAVGNTSTTSSIEMTLAIEGDGRPASELSVAPRGSTPITQQVAAPLFLAPDGGCTPDPRARGTIAVVDRYGAGPCTSYAERAQVQSDMGASAVLFYYNDRAFGGVSTTALPLPAVAIGTAGGDALMAWLRAGPADPRATIPPGIRRGYSDTPDLLAGSSSQGPAFDWAIKPDLSAPGTGILSSFTNGTEAQPSPTFGASSGTSMSAPHVAGAAGLIRSAHPDWPAALVRGTLINTSKRAIRVPVAGAPARDATFTEGGPGRLDLTHAVDPGAFLSPPTASFGKIAAGAPAVRTIVVSSALSETADWTVSVERLGGDGTVAVDPERLAITPTGIHTLTATIETAGLVATEHWGDIVLRQVGTDRVLRLPYYAFVDSPARHKDALVINWTVGNTPDPHAVPPRSADYGRVYTETLAAVRLTYDVWWVDEDPANAARGAVRAHPPFEVLQRYGLVILNTNMSRVSLQEAFSGSYQYFNHLLAGGNLLIAGQGPQSWWTVGQRQAQQGASQNAGCDMCLSRYMAGFQFGITATLTGRLLSWPERPAEPEVEVVLRRHAGDRAVYRDELRPFDFAVDISTGKLAKDGAAGNQYRFASGGLLGTYDPAREYPYTEGVFDRVRPWARPLWTYDGRIVGTYVAGRHHPEARIPWNAMYWGFGLEGVGHGSPETVGRARLLGDTFNFLARNLWVEGVHVAATAARSRRLRLVLPPHADIPPISRVYVDWGERGLVQTIGFDPPVPADRVTVAHAFGSAGTFDVALGAIPAAPTSGTQLGAAPLFATARVDIDAAGRWTQAWLPRAEGR